MFCNCTAFYLSMNHINTKLIKSLVGAHRTSHITCICCVCLKDHKLQFLFLENDIIFPSTKIGTHLFYYFMKMLGTLIAYSMFITVFTSSKNLRAYFSIPTQRGRKSSICFLFGNVRCTFFLISLSQKCELKSGYCWLWTRYLWSMVNLRNANNFEHLKKSTDKNCTVIHFHSTGVKGWFLINWHFKKL